MDARGSATPRNKPKRASRVRTHRTRSSDDRRTARRPWAALGCRARHDLHSLHRPGGQLERRHLLGVAIGARVACTTRSAKRFGTSSPALPAVIGCESFSTLVIEIRRADYRDGGPRLHGELARAAHSTEDDGHADVRTASRRPPERTGPLKLLHDPSPNTCRVCPYSGGAGPSWSAAEDDVLVPATG